MSVAELKTVYAPRSDLMAKLRRRSARVLAKDVITPKLDRGLVSLSFDDCPRSVVDNALPLIEAEGWRATIYAAMGLCDTTNHLGLHMSADDVLATHHTGHEIGDHTYSHLDAMAAGDTAFLADIDRNMDALAGIGVPRPTTFAYPYGEVTPSVKRALSSRFALRRGIHSPSGQTVDLGLAACGKLYSADIDATLSLIEEAAKERRWLILFGHDVRETPSEFGCTPDELRRVIDGIVSAGLDVLPVRDALAKVQS